MKLPPLPLAAFLAARLAFAADWPQYRGPAASGLDESAALPTTWDVQTGANIRWQTPIPGLAHASPIVWGDRVYIATAVKPGTSELRIGLYGDIESVTENQPQQWRLLALDKATGAIVWDTLALETRPPHSPTPVPVLTVHGAADAKANS